jgi:malonyl-CoA O-methyltransferase
VRVGNSCFSEIVNIIAQHFDKAAPHYDQSAPVQAYIATKLVARARPALPPKDILDIGCGTGLVASAIARRWPQATVTALDVSSAMLEEAQRKLHRLTLIVGDAATTELSQRFDLIFSSMALQWLPHPQAALRRWRGWLKPNGRLCVALPVLGSFQEWRDVCAMAGVKDGLRRLPAADFVGPFAAGVEYKDFVVSYSSAVEFLRRLKSIGAATPDEDHRPVGIVAMRALLAMAPRPFTVTYRIAYMTMSSPRSI